uniref:XPG N-terminal domain-containing protein n=1 Tax=viral metagenome TaxID=1070528 RepID=A0A6C0JMD4_9ZZZZ
MGIKNLNKFLRNNCPEIYEEIHISEYSFKKVAIDISLYLCKFKTICGDRWLSAFINLIACLRKNEVHCVFIYDTGAPPEKEAERKERAAQRAKLEEKVYKLEEAMEKFHLSGEIGQILIDLYKRRTNKSDPPRLMKRKIDEIDMGFVEGAVTKMRGQILDIKPEDFQKTKELFDILKVPYFNAPLEAETTCADLCKRGLVDAVLSEDTDVMAYAAPVFLSKINTTNGTCTRIKYPDILEQLELKSEEFLDLCIMCGCDYNKNIFRVGPEKAYKYIQKYSSIEGVAANTKLDVSILNHVRGRELFRDYEKVAYKIKYCGTPDFQKLEEFIFKNNIRCSVEGLKKSFVHQTTIVFEEGDDDQELVIEEEEDEELVVEIE